jgi:hypothetical protein
MRILRGRSLQVWLPERENQRPDQRLQLLRGSMQLLFQLQLQDQVIVQVVGAVFSSEGPGCALRWARMA